MKAKVLTDRTLRALKSAPAGKRVLVQDSLVPGLAVRVTDRGSKSFVLVKRFPGSKHPTPRALGEYGALTLEAARAKARSWLEAIQKGVDPAVQEEQQRAAEQARRADSVASAFELFAKHHLATLRSGRQVEAAMRRVMLPKWGKRPLSEIGRRDVVSLVYELHDAGSPIAANRLLAWTKTFFAWCVERGRLDSSVAALVKRPSKERARDRVLADHELRAIWHACGHLGPYGRAIKFLLCTGQRRGEVGGATWGEVDLAAKVWRLPASRTKSARSHELPLPDMAIGVPGQPGAGFIFAVGSWSKGKATLDKLAREELGEAFQPWRVHDLRRSVATNLARLGVDRIVIGKLLNHSDGSSVTAVYDRHGRDREKVEAMRLWGARLAEIVDDPQPVADVVVPLRRQP